MLPFTSLQIAGDAKERHLCARNFDLGSGRMKRFFLVSLSCSLLCAAPLALAQPDVSGYTRYTIDGSRIHISIGELSNPSDTRTERLRVRMWASEEDWQPDRKGRQITIAMLPPLKPLAELYGVDVSARLHYPPEGWYYVAMTLEERTLDENGTRRWVIRDVVLSDYRYYFEKSDSPF